MICGVERQDPSMKSVFHVSVNAMRNNVEVTMAHTSLMEIMCRNSVILYCNVGSSSELNGSRIENCELHVKVEKQNIPLLYFEIFSGYIGTVEGRRKSVKTAGETILN